MYLVYGYPFSLIRYTLIHYYYYNNSFNFSSFKQEFNLVNLKKIILLVLICFSLKCLLFIALDIIIFYGPKLISHFDKYVSDINTYLSKYKQHHHVKIRPLCAAPGKWATFVIGAHLPFVDDKHDSYIWNPAFLKDYKALINNGFIYNNSSKLILPNSYKLNPDHGVYKQLENFKDANNIYVRVSKDKAALLSYLRTQCTKSLNTQRYDMFSVKGFPNIYRKTVLDLDIMMKRKEVINTYDKMESPTYGYLNELLHDIFNVNDGYMIDPQSERTNGIVDFTIEKDGDIICVIEAKSLNGNYSFTQLYTQAIEYANANISCVNVHVIVMKGDLLSFGMYIQDFHTTNSFCKKSILFDGYLGVQVHKDLSVQVVPQMNVWEPQHKLYWAGHNNEQNTSIYRCLEEIRRVNKNIDPRNIKLDGHELDLQAAIDWDKAKYRLGVSEEVNKNNKNLIPLRIKFDNGIDWDKGKHRFCATQDGKIYERAIKN